MAANTPWGARTEHTSVIDAAGNIYVLGGNGDKCTGGASGLGRSVSCNDEWRSADQGAAPHYCAPPPPCTLHARTLQIHVTIADPCIYTYVCIRIDEDVYE